MNVSVEIKNGQRGISIDGKYYPPLAFKSFRANPRNVSEVYASGVRLFTVLSSGVISGLGVPYSRYGESWIGDGVYDFEPVDRQMDMFLQNAPDGYFAPMFQIDTRPWYLEKHPEYPNSFTHLSQIAGDPGFRDDVTAYLQAVVSHCEEKYGDRIFGYFLLGGTTTEWFSDHDYEASHPIKEAAFRRYLHDDHAKLPEPEAFVRPGKVFLDPAEEPVREARQFHAELISDLVLHCARAVNDITGHKKLLGMYFGYLFELGTPRLHNAGHLAYESVFCSDEIDMISSPSSYAYRSLNDPSAFMVTNKSLDIRNKLYFLEFDHRTHTIPMVINEPIDVNDRNTIFKSGIFPGAENRCATETDSVNLMYRDFLLCQANHVALWWFDMFDGWFRSDGMLAAMKNMTEIQDRLTTYPRESAAEVAVFAEGGESMYHVRKSAPVAKSLSDIRRTFAEAGAPYDLYSTFDLVSMPELFAKYRMFIFIDCYAISEKTRAIIDSVCRQAGKTVLFLYAPDYATGFENTAERISAFTGIHVKEQDTGCGKLVWDGVPTKESAAPCFCIDDPDAVPLASFENGKTAAAETEVDGCTTVYLASYDMPSGFLRMLYHRHGIFVYSEDSHVYTYPDSALIGVYLAVEHNAVISVKEDGIYTDLIEGGSYTAENGKLVLPVKPIRAFLLARQMPGSIR